MKESHNIYKIKYNNYPPFTEFNNSTKIKLQLKNKILYNNFKYIKTTQKLKK